MAALVATMAYFPLGLALIWVLHLGGVGFETLISFGGALPVLIGLMVWWMLFFAAALVYAVFVFARADPAFTGPRKH